MKKAKKDAFSNTEKTQTKRRTTLACWYQESTLLEFDPAANGKFRMRSINIYDAQDNLLLSVPEN